MRKFVFLTLITVIATWPVDHAVGERALRNQPFEPFRVIGNIFYVGPSGVSSFLIVTPAGSILLDAGYQETAALIAQNIADLGFRVSDLKYLLNSHVHADHFGGLAQMKKLSGATMVASAKDAYWLQIGNANAGAPPVVVDRTIGDGETLTLGGTTLTAHITPGLTAGATTWTMTTVDGGRPYRVIFYCSTALGPKLVDNTQYPNVVADYEKTFEKMRTLTSDVFLASHPEFFDMQSKRKRMVAGGPNPFIDPTELSRYTDQSEREFRAELEREQSRKTYQ
jgi:metallo-beta-lactamase class B